jgi:hypothetical protein
MNKKIIIYMFTFISFSGAQVGRIDFSKKYAEWSRGNPNTITYNEFQELLKLAQESSEGLKNIIAVINLPDLELDRTFNFVNQAGREMVTTPLIMAMLAKLPTVVDQILSRGASLTFQSAWRTPFELILLTKEDLIRNIIGKSRGLKNISEQDFLYITTSLTDQERALIDQLAPSVLDKKIAEYSPVMEVIEKYAYERKEENIAEAIAGYKQKMQYITGGVKSAYSAGTDA